MLFNKFTNFAIQKGYDLARKKGVRCPDCGKDLELPYKIPPEGLDGRVECRSCHWNGSLREIIDENFEEEESSNLVVKPEDSRVIETMEMEGRCWMIPARNKFNFFWFFSLFWLAITVFVTFGFIFGDPVDSHTGEPASKWWILFLVPFWVIGLAVLYIALRMSFGETKLLVGKGKVTLKNRLFGWERVKELALGQVQRVGLDVAYRQDESPVYQLVVSSEKKHLKFGSGLHKRDKQWLEQELRKALAVQNLSLRKEQELDQDSVKITFEELEEFSTKAVSLKKLTGEGFKVEVVHRYPKFLLLGGLFALAVGGFVGFEGIKIFESIDEELSFFTVLSKIMDVIPLIIGFVFCLIGLSCLAMGVKFFGVVDHYEFSTDQMIWQRKKRGNRLTNKRYDKKSFSAIRRKNSGQVNNEARYKLTVRGEQNVKICSYVDKRIAKLIELWVLHWLEKKELNEYATAKDI